MRGALPGHRGEVAAPWSSADFKREAWGDPGLILRRMPIGDIRRQNRRAIIAAAPLYRRRPHRRAAIAGEQGGTARYLAKLRRASPSPYADVGLTAHGRIGGGGGINASAKSGA